MSGLKKATNQIKGWYESVVESIDKIHPSDRTPLEIAHRAHAIARLRGEPTDPAYDYRNGLFVKL